MKRRLALITAVLLLVLTLMPSAVFAEASGNPLVVDAAELLTEEEWQTLYAALYNVSEAHQCEVIVFTAPDTEGYGVVEYTDDFYDYYGFGYGENKDGLMLALYMEERDWAISTCGYGIEAFTDAGQNSMMEQVLTYFAEDDYYNGFMCYAQLCDELLTAADNGDPIDVHNIPKPEKSINKLPIDLIGGIVVGLLIAFGIVSMDKAALKTVRHEAAAKNYLVDNSLNITHEQEIFRYRHVDVIPKPDDDDGGSSTHTSSSGTTHGGSSGKF